MLVNSNIPSIELETYLGTRSISLLSKQLTERKIFILGEITTSSNVILQLMYLMQEDNTKPITIYINSPGGSVNDGLAILDAIEACKRKCPIHTVCISQAYSMGAVLLSAGTKRFILPHSKVMIHEPLISGGVGGSATSVTETAKSLLQVKNTLNEILAKNTGNSIKKINNATKIDNYMNAKESIEFGICDEILYDLI